MDSTSANKTEKETDMQVLVLGMPRTSTTSMRFALKDLGYGKHYYWGTLRCPAPRGHITEWKKLVERKYLRGEKLTRKDFEGLLRGYASVADWPCALFAEELIDAYPEAKVILSVRDSPDAWVRSFGSTVWKYNSRRFLPQTPWERLWKWVTDENDACAQLVRTNFFSTRLQHFETDGRQWYLDHNQSVRDHTPSDRFLEFSASQGWEPLCAFLGKDVPEKPFHDLNHTDKFQDGCDRNWMVFRFRKYDSWLKIVSRCMLLVAVLSSLLAFASSRGIFRRLRW